MHYVEHNLNDNKHQDAPPTMLMENLKTKLETKTTLAQGSTKMNLSRPRKNLSNHHEKYEALKLCRPHQSSMSLIGWLIHQTIDPPLLFISFLYRCSHAHDTCEGTRHACDALLTFGSHALHVMHDNHVAHSSSHVWEFTCKSIMMTL